MILVCFWSFGCNIDDLLEKNRTSRKAFFSEQKLSKQNWLVIAPLSEQKYWDTYFKEKRQKKKIIYNYLVEYANLHFAGNFGNIETLLKTLETKLEYRKIDDIDIVLISPTLAASIDWMSHNFAKLIDTLKPKKYIFIPDDAEPKNTNSPYNTIIPMSDGRVRSGRLNRISTAKEFVIWELGGFSIDAFTKDGQPIHTLPLGEFGLNFTISGNFSHVTFKSPFKEVFQELKTNIKADSDDFRLNKILKTKDMWLSIMTELKLDESDKIIDYKKLLHEITKMRIALNKKIMERYCLKVETFNQYDDPAGFKPYPGLLPMRRYYKCKVGN